MAVDAWTPISTSDIIEQSLLKIVDGMYMFVVYFKLLNPKFLHKMCAAA